MPLWIYKLGEFILTAIACTALVGFIVGDRLTPAVCLLVGVFGAIWLYCLDWNFKRQSRE